MAPLAPRASSGSASSTSAGTPWRASACATAQPTTPPPITATGASAHDRPEASPIGSRLAEAGEVTLARAPLAAAKRGKERQVQIQPFAIERFYERWEFRAELMLSSSDCESLSVGELLALEPGAGERLLDLRLGYTEVPGSPSCARRSPRGYELLEPQDVLTLAAAEEGIFIAYHALLGARRPRGRGGALLRLGDRGGAQHGRRGEPLAAPLRGRLGARPRCARALAAAEHRS